MEQFLPGTSFAPQTLKQRVERRMTHDELSLRKFSYGLMPYIIMELKGATNETRHSKFAQLVPLILSKYQRQLRS